MPNENDGGCKCADCPPRKCRPGQRPMPVRGTFSGTPGNCCPRYNCVPSGNGIYKREPRREMVFAEYNDRPCVENPSLLRKTEKMIYDHDNIARAFPSIKLHSTVRNESVR